MACSDGHHNNISIFVWDLAVIRLLHLRKLPILFYFMILKNIISYTARSDSLLSYKLAMDGLQCKCMCLKLSRELKMFFFFIDFFYRFIVGWSFIRNIKFL